MVESYYLVAWWRQRRVTREEFALCIERFFARLKKVDHRFSNLHKLGTSISRPVGKPIGYSFEDILKDIRENKRFPDLGFTYWAVLPDESISTHINEGTCCKVSNPANSVFIEFEPVLDEKLVNLLKVEKLFKILDGAVEEFKPVWGGIITSKHREQALKFGGEPFASWMLYLPYPIDSIPDMPEGVEIRYIEEKGCVIITTQELFNVENKNHTKIADEVTKRLHRSGLLADLDCTKYVNELVL